MIYYNLTCIKELPNIDKNFQCSHISEDELKNGPYDKRYDIRFNGEFSRIRQLKLPHEEEQVFMDKAKEDAYILKDKLHTLFKYADYSEYVEKTLDLSKANQELVCPYCNQKTLYHYNGGFSTENDDDVRYTYIELGLQCGLCKKIYMTGEKVCVNTKVCY